MISWFYKHIALLVTETLVDHQQVIRAEESEAVRLHSVVKKPCQRRLDRGAVLRLGKHPASSASRCDLGHALQHNCRTASCLEQRKEASSWGVPHLLMQAQDQSILLCGILGSGDVSHKLRESSRNTGWCLTSARTKGCSASTRTASP